MTEPPAERDALLAELGGPLKFAEMREEGAQHGQRGGDPELIPRLAVEGQGLRHQGRTDTVAALVGGEIDDAKRRKGADERSGPRGVLWPDLEHARQQAPAIARVTAQPPEASDGGGQPHAERYPGLLVITVIHACTRLRGIRLLQAPVERGPQVVALSFETREQRD